MRFSPDGESEWRTQCGGYGRILTRLTALRQQAEAAGQTCLLLHGGDTFQGSLYFNRFKGRANADLLALLRPDAMVIGNHEFDWGPDNFNAWSRDGKFPFLAANIVDKRTGQVPSWTKPYQVVLLGGHKIAFVGFSTIETLSKTKADYVADYDFLEPAKVAAFHHPLGRRGEQRLARLHDLSCVQVQAKLNARLLRRVVHLHDRRLQ